MPKTTSEIETKTKLSAATKISLGFSLAIGIITVGLLAFAGLYTFLVNHSGQPAVSDLTDAPAPITANFNNNTNTNTTLNSDYNFTTE